MFWAPILSLLFIPIISLLLLLCIRNTEIVDEEHGTHITMDEDNGEDLTYRTNKNKPRGKSNQQGLSVRNSKQIDKLLSGHIQSIPALQLDDFVSRVSIMHQERDKLFRDEYEALVDLIEDCIIVTAIKPENASKNRYKNILPYEHSRIILKKETEEQTEVWVSRSKVEKSDGSGFINASYISGYNREREYIAAQGPLPETIADFWWMLWQENTSQVIMACNLIESGRVKCSSYWPNEEEVSQDYGRVRVTLLSKKLSPCYVTRTFSISMVPTLTPTGSVSSLTPDSPSEKETATAETDRQRRVTHYQFTGWPDFGTPLTASPLLGLVRKVRSAVGPSDGPILVHCSAGVGRTGTFIMLDIMLQKMAIESQVEVRHTVQLLRKERGYMVQSLAQYVFLHDALVEAFLCGITEIPSQQLEANCKEFAADNQLLEQLLRKLPDPGNFFVHQTAVEKANVDKNRDCTIIPYQRTCVPLQQYKSENEHFDVSVKNSYINASFVQGYWLDNNFIVTQEPLPETAEDFWSLLAQQSCPCIVSLQSIRCQEEGLASTGSGFSIDSVDSVINVAYYLPNESEPELEFNQFKVEQLECTSHEDQLLMERKLIIKWGKKEHRITHFTFHFNSLLLSNISQTYSDKIPFGLRELVSFVNHTRGLYRSQQIAFNLAQPQRSKHPILLYDKLGTNLCGVFTALFIGMDNLDNEESFDLLQCCRNLCSERPKMISSIGDVFLILRGLVLYQKEFRQISH